MTVKVSLEELLKSGAHFGHRTRRWNPKMKHYLHGEQDGVHIFDLLKTKEALDEALVFLSGAAKEEKKIVFVGTKKQSKDAVRELAKETGKSFVNERWLGGTLTNFEMIKRSLDKFADMKKKREEGEYKKFTKKERLMIDREIERLDRFFGGISNLEKEPDILVVVDVKKEKGAVVEARKTGLATVGIVDSNSDPTLVDYPIPMNDDASKALTYVLGLIKEAVLEGNSKVKAKPKEKKAQ